jgi:hypothetical protein
MAKILIKFPTRGRRHVFKNTFDLYYNMLSGKHDYEFRVTMDVDDNSMNTQEIFDFLDAKKNVTYCYGENKSKIQAINANMKDAEFDVVLLASDDMIPKVHDYDDIIMQAYAEHYPEYDGAVWFNDGRAGAALCTLSILGKKLYDRFGYIYHPDYVSLWCDNEFHEVCHLWGKMTYVDRVIIQHAWTDVTGGDPLHVRNESFHDRDRRMYEARKGSGFPTESVSIAEYKKSRDQRRREVASRRRA